MPLAQDSALAFDSKFGARPSRDFLICWQSGDIDAAYGRVVILAVVRPKVDSTGGTSELA